MKTWKFSMGALIVTSLVSLFGCAAYTPDYSTFIQEASSRHVPLLIYNTSWNDPKNGGGRLAVWVANIQDKTIDSIELTVSVCGAKGSANNQIPLILGGPFAGPANYISLPSWPIDVRSYSGSDAGDKEATGSPGHLVIQSIKISYADGKQEIYDKDVGQWLTKNISNYCTTNIDVSL